VRQKILILTSNEHYGDSATAARQVGNVWMKTLGREFFPQGWELIRSERRLSAGKRAGSGSLNVQNMDIRIGRSDFNCRVSRIDAGVRGGKFRIGVDGDASLPSERLAPDGGGAEPSASLPTNRAKEIVWAINR